MNNDGVGFTGAGTSDNRLGGDDLQHSTQGTGGPIKAALEREMQQHKTGKHTRLKHLEEHYKR